MTFDVFRSYFSQGNEDKFMLTAQAEFKQDFLDSEVNKAFDNYERFQLLSEVL